MKALLDGFEESLSRQISPAYQIRRFTLCVFSTPRIITYNSKASISVKKTRRHYFPTLLPLTEKGLVESCIERKKACKLTKKSAKTSAITLSLHDKIKGFMSTIFKVQPLL